MKYEDYLRKLQLLIGLSDVDSEQAHQDADTILCDIALSASVGDLNNEQVRELIANYNKVEKWYA